ncbi:hypothetical protein QUF54_01290 [Candidatus Marithioploca araucensis]|uniref:Uncharacterized protein n=1 Tax=Candidatus Marithioploca araucensis TaxID=70273 RepID=A0ABT7VQN7_9GAMM|nr:hypothetical protein [Candidatus Marithioploca araucensis]
MVPLRSYPPYVLLVIEHLKAGMNGAASLLPTLRFAYLNRSLNNMMIAENEAEEYQLAEQKKQVYLNRVNQLFGHIKNWLKEESVAVKQQDIEIVEKFTGHYTVPSLSISTQAGQKLVDINPGGAYTLMAEGLLDVEGGFGREHVMYIVEGGPYINKLASDEKDKLIRQQTYKDIDDDGWYWIEETLRDKAHFMNKNALIEIITQVSDYEFV